MVDNRTDSEKVMDACWNYLGTIDPEKVSRHLGNYCRIAAAADGIPILNATPQTDTMPR